MQGIELSHKFYKEYGEPMLKEKFSEHLDKIAVGLVGSGSECFGFDDSLSPDHDFDCGFYIFINRDTENEIGFKLFRAYNDLIKEHGVMPKERSLGGKEKGVVITEDFYRFYTGRDGAPLTLQDWLYTPFNYLAECTNGRIFFDGSGEFSAIRERILSGMPNDIWLKRLAGNLLNMAQSGQYNFKRCLNHNEKGAAMLALSKFCEYAAETVYILNRKYPPYYKWLLRGMDNLEILGEVKLALTSLLCDNLSDKEKYDAVESVCGKIIDELLRQKLCQKGAGYLEPYAYIVNDLIKNGEIRTLPI